MPNLKGTKTHENLKSAFAGESQANRRYLYFAKQADVEGRPDIAGLFRDTAEGETGHAHGHLEYLEQVGDPVTGEPIGDSEKNLAAAVAGETYEYTQMYPGFARQAREGNGSQHVFAPQPPFPVRAVLIQFPTFVIGPGVNGASRRHARSIRQTATAMARRTSCRNARRELPCGV